MDVDDKTKNAFSNIKIDTEGQLPPPNNITLEGIVQYTADMKKMTEELPDHGSHLEYILVPLKSLIGKERVLMYELG